MALPEEKEGNAEPRGSGDHSICKCFLHKHKDLRLVTRTCIKKLSMAVHTCNCSPWEVKGRGIVSWSQPGQHSKFQAGWVYIVISHLKQTKTEEERETETGGTACTEYTMHVFESVVVKSITMYNWYVLWKTFKRLRNKLNPGWSVPIGSQTSSLNFLFGQNTGKRPLPGSVCLLSIPWAQVLVVPPTPALRLFI